MMRDAAHFLPRSQVKIIRLGDRYLDLHSPQERARASPTALRAFLSLMSEWEVADEEARVLVGHLTSEAFAALRKTPDTQVLDAAQLKRIASLLGIHRELGLLYGASVASEWVRLPNSHPMFCRVKPLAYMVIGGVQAMSNVLRLLAKRRKSTVESAADDGAPL